MIERVYCIYAHNYIEYNYIDTVFVLINDYASVRMHSEGIWKCV